MTRTLTVALAFLTAPLASEATGAEPVRLATFNIHHAEGTDGVLDLERVAGVVREADVVAFQEVDVRFGPRSRSEDQAARLGELLGGKAVFGGNLVVGDGQYGVALVSKFPIVSSKNHPLPRSPGREKAEPRGLLETVLDVGGKRLRVYVTHLAHDSPADRLLQVDAVRAIVSAGEGPALLMGDLNFRPTDELYGRLLAPAASGESPLFVDAWVVAGKGDGHTIGLEGKSPGRIDYVLGSPEIAQGFGRTRVDVETVASDHQPVFVNLRLP